MAKTSMILRYFAHMASITVLVCAFSNYTYSQSEPPIGEPPASSQDRYNELINSNTITILGASLSGSYIKIVDDIAAAVNKGHKLRVLPIIGEGGSQNIRDILYLKGVDAGIVMSTSLDSYNGQKLFEHLPQRLQYIARLYEEEFHIVASPNIGSIDELAGKKVGFHGGAFVSGQELLVRLKIKPSEAVKVSFFDGLEQIKTGEIAAIIRATASPMKDFDDSFDPKFHKLISVPFDDTLVQSHLPAKLTHKQYPKIIPEGEAVETAAIGVVLASYAWKPGTDRYRRVAQFTKAFFSNIEKLLANPKRHPKWDDVNLAASLPGWQRFPAAEEWLEEHGESLRHGSTASLKGQFTSFIESQSNSGLSAEKREALFKEFQEWRKSVGQ